MQAALDPRSRSRLQPRLQPCACAKVTPTYKTVSKTPRCTLAVELGMSRKPHERYETTGTAFTAVAPSERPAFAAHRSNIREWYCPQARIAGHLTFRPLVRFQSHH